MGAPLFKIRDIVEKNHVAVFSSNFALYGDMSRRVQEVLREFAPAVEQYSIDEAFLDLNGLGLYPAAPDNGPETLCPAWLPNLAGAPRYPLHRV